MEETVDGEIGRYSLAVANCYIAGAVDKQFTYIRRLHLLIVVVNQLDLVHVLPKLVEYEDPTSH